jgi:hypothetical protein
MTKDEFYKELEAVSGIQYSKETERFFYTMIVDQFKAYKKTHTKVSAYLKAHEDLIS